MDIDTATMKILQLVTESTGRALGIAEDQDRLRAILEAVKGGEPAACNCRRCLDDREFASSGIPVSTSRTRMVVCATCGNKRCPHAVWHGYACTRSNEPGQIKASPMPIPDRVQREIARGLELGAKAAEYPATPPASEPAPAKATISHPLSDLVFRRVKPPLTQEQAVSVAAVLLENYDHRERQCKVEIDRLRAERDGLREQLAEEKREYGKLAEESYRRFTLLDAAQEENDAIRDQLTARDDDVQRLKQALRKANDGFEEYERKYYLTLNTVEAIRAFAEAHHCDQPLHVLLHGLTVDIPALCDSALASSQPAASGDELTSLREQLAGKRRDLAAALRWITAAERIGKAAGYEHAELEASPEYFADRVVEIVAGLREQLAEAKRERDAASEALDANWVTHQQLTARDDELRRLREALNAIIVRCTEGDTASDWLPTIASIARAALASPPPPRTITGDGQPLPSGVWSRQVLSAGPGDRSMVGVQYTYVGPVPAAEQEEHNADRS